MSVFYQTVRNSFSQIAMQTRFVDRTSGVAGRLKPSTRRFFMRSGGAIRTTARRMLKKAPQQKLSDLNPIERANYETNLRLFKTGKTRTRPRRPDRVSLAGRPPLLHSTADNGQSPLKYRLWFAVTEDGTSVLIGPAAIGSNGTVVRRKGISTLRELERSHPFMAPAYQIIEPKMPGFLKEAMGTLN